MDTQPELAWKQLFLNLSRRVDVKVTYNGTHSTHVAYWVKAIAKKLELSEQYIHTAFWASLFHDIGKIGVPDEVLTKNGPLTEDEWVIMKLHPVVGANIVNSLNSLADTTSLIRSHQEKFDGSGYPKGLIGLEIPLGARILAVVDAYDAMTNKRVYRSACSHEEAVTELNNMRGRHFDPQVVDVFLEVLESQSYTSN
jgi:putative nucleotidyltransferase with HDIG domain